MTRSPDLPRKRHKWLGRLLGCFSGKSHVEGSSDRGSGYIEHTSWLDPYSGEEARPRKAKRLDGKVGRTSLPSGRSGEWMSPCFFLGDLEWALLKEGLLEYRDPAASIPVLSICHGFSDEELKSLSKRRHYLQLNRLWDKEMVEGLDKVLRIDGLEPFIDGLPASVWLECVEPTLSILISLNALRHRRSNLSVKRGAPEVLDSSRSRHGDFEFGPIAIFHHPRRIQQMMLLRFEFLNTVTTDPVELGELHRSHDHIRRSYNRPRRFRNLRGTEDDGGPPSSKNRDDSIDARNNDKCVRAARGHVSACDTCRQPVLPEEHGCNSRSSSCCCNCSSSSCSCSSYTSSSCNSTSCNCSNNNSCTLNICPEIPACEQRSGNNLDTRVETSIRNPKPGRFPAIGQSPCHDLRQSLRCLNNNNNSSNNVSTDGGSPALIAISDRLQMLPGQDPSQSATGSAATRSEWPAMDLMALGDHTVWMLTSRRYITIPAQAHRRAWHGVIGITAIKGGTGDGEDATGMDRTEGRLSTRRSPWNFSRRLVRRARGWKNRLERSIIQRDKHSSRR